MHVWLYDHVNVHMAGRIVVSVRVVVLLRRREEEGEGRRRDWW